jgi:hypothetical protein
MKSMMPDGITWLERVKYKTMILEQDWTGVVVSSIDKYVDFQSNTAIYLL